MLDENIVFDKEMRIITRNLSLINDEIKNTYITGIKRKIYEKTHKHYTVEIYKYYNNAIIFYDIIMIENGVKRKIKRINRNIMKTIIHLLEDELS